MWMPHFSEAGLISMVVGHDMEEPYPRMKNHTRDLFSYHSYEQIIVKGAVILFAALVDNKTTH